MKVTNNTNRSLSISGTVIRAGSSADVDVPEPTGSMKMLEKGGAIEIAQTEEQIAAADKAAADKAAADKAAADKAAADKAAADKKASK